MVALRDVEWLWDSSVATSYWVPPAWPTSYVKKIRLAGWPWTGVPDRCRTLKKTN